VFGRNFLPPSLGQKLWVYSTVSIEVQKVLRNIVCYQHIILSLKAKCRIFTVLKISVSDRLSLFNLSIRPHFSKYRHSISPHIGKLLNKKSNIDLNT